jgi:hypothetical protein
VAELGLVSWLGLTRAWSGRGGPRRSAWAVCAGHGTERARGKSWRQVFAQPKARQRARAPPRGGVWRKPNPQMRGDAQEPETRGGTAGTSGPVPAKSSMRGGMCFINPASTHRKRSVLPREICMASKLKVWMK